MPNRNLKKTVIDNEVKESAIRNNTTVETNIKFNCVSNQVNRTVYKAKFNLDNIQPHKHIRRQDNDVSKHMDEKILNDHRNNKDTIPHKESINLELIHKEGVINNAIKTIERIISKKNIKGTQESKLKRNLELRLSKSISLQGCNKLATTTISNSTGLENNSTLISYIDTKKTNKKDINGKKSENGNTILAKTPTVSVI